MKTNKNTEIIELLKEILSKVSNSDTKYQVGDIVRYQKRGCEKEIGTVKEVRDQRTDKLLTESGRDFYYFVEYSKGATTVRETEITGVVRA